MNMNIFCKQIGFAGFKKIHVGEYLVNWNKKTRQIS